MEYLEHLEKLEQEILKYRSGSLVERVSRCVFGTPSKLIIKIFGQRRIGSDRIFFLVWARFGFDLRAQMKQKIY